VTKKDQPKKPRKGAILSKTGKEMGKYRQWPSLDSFKRWRTKHMKERANVLKEKLSPLEYYVTQGMGHERPYTGDLWWTKDVGMYSCKCCT